MPETPNHLFAFGCGYSAKRLAVQQAKKGWKISGTSTRETGVSALEGEGIQAWIFDGSDALPDAAFSDVTHILISIPPRDIGDQILRLHADRLAKIPNLKWIGILSTTGVYGDTKGAWITEKQPPAPLTRANEQRLIMEDNWLAFGKTHNIAVQVFRLPGIYGPTRSPFDRIRSGKARRILKEGHVFNRVHVDDIVQACQKGMAHPNAGPIFHIADGAPEAADVVLSYAAELINIPAPKAVQIEDAQLSPMAQHFYSECKRLDISLARTALGFDPIYKDYREGLRAILAEESP